MSAGLAITSTGRQHRRNASQRAVDVVQDLFVFQSQHALAVVQQELIALCIQVHPTAVWRAVQLDNKASLSAVEVHDVATDGVLPPEANPQKLAATHARPKHGLGNGWLAPPRPGEWL